MRINGILAFRMVGHTQDSLTLCNRTLEIYITKKLVKFYVFNSSTIGWHKPQNVIMRKNIEIKSSFEEKLQLFQKIKKEHFFTYSEITNFVLKYNNLQTNETITSLSSDI